MADNNQRDIAKLIDEVEALCKVYVGKDAESEGWAATCRRLESLDKIVKRIRKRAAAGPRS